MFRGFLQKFLALQYTDLLLIPRTYQALCYLCIFILSAFSVWSRAPFFFGFLIFRFLLKCFILRTPSHGHLCLKGAPLTFPHHLLCFSHSSPGLSHDLRCVFYLSPTRLYVRRRKAALSVLLTIIGLSILYGTL